MNLGLARRFGLPVAVVGDIDRGGVLASLYGTVALLEPEDRALVRTFLINKFRGDPDVLAPGLAEITRRTGVPFAGVLPWLDGVWLDAEDSLEVGAWRRSVRSGEPGRLRVAVVRLPRVSNATDVEALAAEPGVDVLVTTDPRVVAGADLAVLPGTRATFSDLAWLRRTGLADAVLDRAHRGAPVLGICGGYQMLGARVEDPDAVEADAASGVDGLGLLPVVTRFAVEKSLGRPAGAWRGHPVQAYEIHHGQASPVVAPAQAAPEAFLDGWHAGATWGTVWHGAFENDGFRRAWLAEVAAAAGSSWAPTPDAPAYGARREAMIDALADAVEEHLDLDLLLAGTRVASTAGAVA